MTHRGHGEGSLLRRKGCKIWYAQYYKDGRQIRVSTGEAVYQKALTVLRRLMGDSERGLPLSTDLKKIMYSQLRAGLLANYREKGNRTLYQTADGGETIGGLKALDQYFGFTDKSPGVPLTALTTDAARDFAQKRLAEGYSPATVNRSLSCLRRMLSIAREDGKIQAVPVIRMQKEPPARKGFITIQQCQTLLAALPPHLHPVALYQYWCGGRKGEAFQVDWTQVDLKGGCIRLEGDQTKNEEARIVPLPPVLISILEKAHPKTGLVFDTTNLREEWAKACDAVGFGKREKQESSSGNTWYRYSGLTIHDFRRSATRNLVNALIPENVAMKITGHKTRSVFDRYHIVSADDVTNAMKRLVAATPRKFGANLVQIGQGEARKLLRARSSNG